MKRVLLFIVISTALALAQAPPATNAPQFTVNINFLGGTPYGVNSALDNAVTDQFTTNHQLRGDIITMPGVGYTGFFGGDQYALCAVKGLESLLSTTSLNCGKFSPYVNAAIGLGHISSGSTTTSQGFAGLGRVGANYDPTGSGHFTLNLFEVGYGHFGPGIPGQSNNGWFAQTGFNFGLGTSTASTQAKVARMRRAEAKKMAKLRKKLEKEQKERS